MATLYTTHLRALSLLYSDVERSAASQGEAFLGAPGNVLERSNAGGFRFYAHQSYGPDGKRHERYVAGPVGDPAADAAAAALRERIAEQREQLPSLRTLAREGFGVADARSYATAATLHNHGVFRAGGVLIGSHAYGVLLNSLGVRAIPYATHDVDIARLKELSFDAPPPSFLEMLRTSGIDFVEVPTLDARHRPSTSFKQRGRGPFHVDLVAPSHDETYPAIAVPELGAHASGLPYLAFLLEQTQSGMIMAREACCTVRVPAPERFAVHKLIISQMRDAVSTKAGKDIEQACIIAAAIAEMFEGAIAGAVVAVPKRARKFLERALPRAKLLLADAHPRAWDELSR